LCTGGTVELEHLVFDDLTSYSGVAASHRQEADTSMPYSAGHTSASGFGSFERPSFNPVASYPNAFAGEARHPSAALPQQAEEGLHSSVRATEYQAIMNAIRGSANRNEAAARLGISPRTLRYKLARLREPLHGGMAIASEGAV
ncbi:MAG: helix-turn-helix domain-containing protein, partial [Betaproteobacteria bacterium]